MNAMQKETLRQQLERSAAVRMNIKRYYIYVVLALIVVAFSLLKLDEVTFFGRGHFLSPDSIINLLRSAVPIFILSGAFTLLMISGYIDLSVGSGMSLTAVVFAWLVLNGDSLVFVDWQDLAGRLNRDEVDGLIVARQVDYTFNGHNGAVKTRTFPVAVEGCGSTLAAARVSKSRIRVNRRGQAKVRVQCRRRDATCRGRVTLRGRRVAAAKTFRVPRRKTRTVRLKFSKREVRYSTEKWSRLPDNAALQVISNLEPRCLIS